MDAAVVVASRVVHNRADLFIHVPARNDGLRHRGGGSADPQHQRAHQYACPSFIPRIPPSGSQDPSLHGPDLANTRQDHAEVARHALEIPVFAGFLRELSNPRRLALPWVL